VCTLLDFTFKEKHTPMFTCMFNGRGHTLKSATFIHSPCCLTGCAGLFVTQDQSGKSSFETGKGIDGTRGCDGGGGEVLTC